ncbi:MAG: hypothetical protein ACR2P4_07825 [Gammaproteobacteria bacterium]
MSRRLLPPYPAGGADNIAPRPAEAAQTTKAEAAEHSAIQPAAARHSASFTITDYHRWRDNVAQSANETVIPAKLHSDLFVIDSANNHGAGFLHWRRTTLH